jgi:hypothetical protein
MLFAVIYTVRADTEEQQARSLDLFRNCAPPPGLEVKAHYVAPSLKGIIICEAASADLLFQQITPFTPFFDHEFLPVADVAEAIPLVERAYNWRDTVR